MTRTRSPTDRQRVAGERDVLVGAEPHDGVLDGRVAVVHAERLEPAVGDGAPARSTEITVARTDSAWRNGSPSAPYAVSISAYEPAWISVASVLMS